MIYIIKQTDLYSEYTVDKCLCCSGERIVDFRDLGGYVAEYDIGRKMVLSGGRWVAETHVEFKERTEAVL